MPKNENREYRNMVLEVVSVEERAEDEPDEVYKFANEVADLLCDSASKSERRETLDELGIMDYLDYIIFMFPEFNLEAAQKIAR